MKLKLLLTVLTLTLISAILHCETIATVYSDFGSYLYKNSHIGDITGLGYTHIGYENKDISSLCENIKNYSAVIFCPAYNYTNTVDFTLYKEQLNDYVSDGGILIITDANYPSQNQWIGQVFPNYYFSSGVAELEQEGYNSVYANSHSPLLDNVPSIPLPWCRTDKVSPDWKILARDRHMNPSTVYATIGKGILLASTSYIQQGFPSAQFIKNIIAYQQSDRSLKVGNNLPSKETLPSKKTDMGKLTVLKGNKDINTEWSAYADDYGIKFSFVCSDPDLINTTTKSVKRDDSVWNDDCIEIYISPDSSEDYYYFAVNNDNVVCDAKNTDISFDTYFESKISQTDSQWTGDIYIPYSSAGITENTASFHINACRVYHPMKKESGLCSVRNIPPEALTDISFWNIFTPEKQIDTKKYADTEPLEMILPENMQTGKNRIKLNTKKDCIISDFTAEKTFTAKGGICDITFDSEGPHTLLASTKDSKGGIIASSRSVTVQVTDIMNLVTVYPYYRDIVQSKDPEKTFWLKCSLTDPSKSFTLSWSLSSGKKIIKKGTMPIKGDKEAEIKYDISSLPVGEYDYSVALKKGKEIERVIERHFKVLPPSEFEVTFDRKRICYVNGEPFFPIGLYHTGDVALSWLNSTQQAPTLYIEDMFKDVADHGFNLGLTQSFVFPRETAPADLSIKNGIIYNYELGPNPDINFLNSVTEKYNELNTGLFYYTVDEPINEKLETAIDMYNILKETDPHRPCGAAVCVPHVFREAVKAFDIMMPDTYLYRGTQRDPSLSGLLDPIKIALESCNYQKPLWAVPQAFGWGGDNPGFAIPKREDLRCQMYFYLVYGATGFCWYGYTSPERDDTAPYGFWHLPSSDLWDYLTVLNKEMKEFAPVIIEGESIGPLFGNNEKVRSNVWVNKGTNYAIIVNPEREPQTVTYNIKGEIKPFFGEYTYNYTQTGTDTAFTLQSLECIIIEYK